MFRLKLRRKNLECCEVFLNFEKKLRDALQIDGQEGEISKDQEFRTGRGDVRFLQLNE